MLGFQHQTSQVWVQHLKNNSQILGFQHQTSQVWVPNLKQNLHFLVSNSKLRIFEGTKRKLCFSPRGSVWSFEGGVLLSAALGLTVRTFWSLLE